MFDIILISGIIDDACYSAENRYSKNSDSFWLEVLFESGTASSFEQVKVIQIRAGSTRIEEAK